MSTTRKAYNLQQAAAVLQVQRHTLKKWARSGKAPAPAVQIGSYWEFAAAEIDAFAARRGGRLSGLAVDVFDMAPEQADEAREIERRLSLALWAVGQLVELPADGGAAAALGQAALCLELIEARAGINGAFPGDLGSLHYAAAADSAVTRAGLHAGEYEAQRVAALAVHLVLSVANNEATCETIRTGAASGGRDGLRLVETIRQLRMAIGAYLAESQNPYSAGTLQGS